MLGSLFSRLSFGLLGSRSPVVAVIGLSGVIGAVGPLRAGLTLSGLADQIERAFKLPRLKAVALAINSPGGSPVQSALIGQRIRDLAEENSVPVIAFTEDIAASGGYWLACAADEIYANENSIVGSIGVISAGFGFAELIQRFGVERRVHTSGDRKSLLDPFVAEDPKDVARLKALQKEIHESFKEQVRTRRGERLTGGDKLLFSGEFWTGRRALELGLVDGLGELRQVLRQRYGEKLRLKRVEGARPWWRRRLPFGGREPAPREMAGGLLAAAEERALWARYGL
jgi:serine protease SohB